MDFITTQCAASHFILPNSWQASWKDGTQSLVRPLERRTLDSMRPSSTERDDGPGAALTPLPNDNVPDWEAGPKRHCKIVEGFSYFLVLGKITKPSRLTDRTG